MSKVSFFFLVCFSLLLIPGCTFEFKAEKLEMSGKQTRAGYPESITASGVWPIPNSVRME